MWISEAGTIHRWFSGAYLMTSSGHILLSLLPMLGWVNRSLISWLSFCAVRFLCFFAWKFIPSNLRRHIQAMDFIQYPTASFKICPWNLISFVCHVFPLQVEPHATQFVLGILHSLEHMLNDRFCAVNETKKNVVAAITRALVGVTSFAVSVLWHSSLVIV
jgi:hypothetical protein